MAFLVHSLIFLLGGCAGILWCHWHYDLDIWQEHKRLRIAQLKLEQEKIQEEISNSLDRRMR